MKISHILILVHCDFCICKTGAPGGLTFVSWADLKPATVSAEVLADFSGVCGCLEGHEEIHLTSGSQSFPVTVPLPFQREFPAFGKIVQS